MTLLWFVKFFEIVSAIVYFLFAYAMLNNAVRDTKVREYGRVPAYVVFALAFLLLGVLGMWMFWWGD